MENNKSELIKNLLEQARDFDCLRENLGNMRELLLILQGDQDLMRPRTCWIVAWPEKRIVFLEELLSAAQTQDEAEMVQAVLKVCERGAYKHLDENRELLVTLVREAPHLLNPKQCQVLYWLKRMDGFLQDLIRYLEIPNPFDGVPLDYPPFYGVYPRPWPAAIPQVCGNGKTAGLPERRDAYYEIRKQLTGCLLSRIERVCRQSLRGSSGFCRCPEENNNLMRCFKEQNHPLIAFLSAISRRHQIFFHNFYNAVKNLLSNDPEHPEIRQYERTFSMWPGEDYSEELMRFTADEGEDENSATLRRILRVCEAGGAAGGLLERMDENRRFLETLCVNSDVLELFPWAAGWIQEFDLFFSNLLQALDGELRASGHKPRPWPGKDYSYALIDFDTRRQNENLRSNDMETTERLLKIEDACTFSSGGLHKRIDENRELLMLLQEHAPDLLERFPFIESWLACHDVFLVNLADALGWPLDFCAVCRCSMLPRPWPGKRDIDAFYGQYLEIAERARRWEAAEKGGQHKVSSTKSP